MNPRTVTVLAGLFLAVGAGCGSRSSAPPASADWTGTLVGTGGISGSLTLTFSAPVSASLDATPTALAAATGTISVTGTLHIGPQTITLTGAYDPGTHAFTVSGAGTGGTFTLSGTVTSASGGANITGNFTGPGGTGTFVAVAGTAATVTVFCGTYTAIVGNSGAWNLVEAGTSLTGVASGPAGNLGLTGTVSGSTVNISYSEGSHTGTATGTITGSNIAGTYSSTNGNYGTFSGTTC